MDPNLDQPDPDLIETESTHSEPPLDAMADLNLGPTEEPPLTSDPNVEDREPPATPPPAATAPPPPRSRTSSHRTQKSHTAPPPLEPNVHIRPGRVPQPPPHTAFRPSPNAKHYRGFTRNPRFHRNPRPDDFDHTPDHQYHNDPKPDSDIEDQYDPIISPTGGPIGTGGPNSQNNVLNMIINTLKKANLVPETATLEQLLSHRQEPDNKLEMPTCSYSSNTHMSNYLKAHSILQAIPKFKPHSKRCFSTTWNAILRYGLLKQFTEEEYILILKTVCEDEPLDIIVELCDTHGQGLQAILNTFYELYVTKKHKFEKFSALDDFIRQPNESLSAAMTRARNILIGIKPHLSLPTYKETSEILLGRTLKTILLETTRQRYTIMEEESYNNPFMTFESKISTLDKYERQFNLIPKTAIGATPSGQHPAPRLPPPPIPIANMNYESPDEEEYYEDILTCEEHGENTDTCYDICNMNFQRKILTAKRSFPTKQPYDPKRPKTEHKERQFQRPPPPPPQPNSQNAKPKAPAPATAPRAFTNTQPQGQSSYPYPRPQAYQPPPQGPYLRSNYQNNRYNRRVPFNKFGPTKHKGHYISLKDLPQGSVIIIGNTQYYKCKKPDCYNLHFLSPDDNSPEEIDAEPDHVDEMIEYDIQHILHCNMLRHQNTSTRKPRTYTWYSTKQFYQYVPTYYHWIHLKIGSELEHNIRCQVKALLDSGTTMTTISSKLFKFLTEECCFDLKLETSEQPMLFMNGNHQTKALGITRLRIHVKDVTGQNKTHFDITAAVADIEEDIFLGNDVTLNNKIVKQQTPDKITVIANCPFQPCEVPIYKTVTSNRPELPPRTQVEAAPANPDHFYDSIDNNLAPSAPTMSQVQQGATSPIQPARLNLPSQPPHSPVKRTRPEPVCLKPQEENRFRTMQEKIELEQCTLPTCNFKQYLHDVASHNMLDTFPEKAQLLHDWHLNFLSIPPGKLYPDLSKFKLEPSPSAKGPKPTTRPSTPDSDEPSDPPPPMRLPSLKRLSLKETKIENKSLSPLTNTPTAFEKWQDTLNGIPHPNLWKPLPAPTEEPSTDTLTRDAAEIFATMRYFQATSNIKTPDEHQKFIDEQTKWCDEAERQAQQISKDFHATKDRLKPLAPPALSQITRTSSLSYKTSPSKSPKQQRKVHFPQAMGLQMEVSSDESHKY